MLYRVALAILLLSSSPAFAESDELSPVPVPAVAGRPYFGDPAPSQIRFINVRARAVKIVWIAFDGSEKPYASLQSGEEMIQPTFVAHRWLIKDEQDGTPVEAFISTRSDWHDDGVAQIALIR
jgi:hypothetical protein